MACMAAAEIAAQEKGLAEGREKGLAEGREKGLAEGREKGLAEGMAKGMAKGMAEEKLATAKRLLDMGLDVLQTAKGTGLSIEEVEKLLHS